MFARAWEFAHRYEERVKDIPGANVFACAEIEHRIAQVEMLIEMIKARQTEESALWSMLGKAGEPGVSDVAAQRVIRLKDEIDLFADAFYYMANRIVTIVEKAPANALPYLALDAGELGTWRNRYLEHFRADPNAQYAWVVKRTNRGPSTVKQSLDEGLRESGALFENAEVFAAMLEQRLSAAIASVSPPSIGMGDRRGDFRGTT